MIKLLALSLSLFFAQPQDPADRMLSLATADQPLVHTAIVDAPVKQVWHAWTTTEGIKSWMVPSGEVSLRIGGYLRTSYTPNSDLKGPDVIENTIICFDQERMLSFRTTKVPERFPFKNAMANAWTVVYFEPQGERTKVICRMNGYSQEEESMKMKRFFQQGNQATLDALVKRFRSSRR